MFCHNLLIDSLYQQNPCVYCGEMEISIAEEKPHCRDGARGGEQSTMGKGNVPLEGLGMNLELCSCLLTGGGCSVEFPVLLFGPIKAPKCPWGRGCLSLPGALGLLIKIENSSLFAAHLHRSSWSRMVCSCSPNKGCICLGY